MRTHPPSKPLLAREPDKISVAYEYTYELGRGGTRYATTGAPNVGNGVVAARKW